MASGTIKWMIAAMSREAGQIETDIELDTDLIRDLLEQGRIVLVEEEPKKAPVVTVKPTKE